MDEFSLIDKYLKPLARGFPGSLELTDDAALIDVPPGQQLVITKDAISEGIHFLGSEPPSLIAQKLLRTNLSDLAAKGATPLCYFMAGLMPKSTDEAWVKSFTEGLAAGQKQFAIHLAGGDTTSTKGTLGLSMTALGLVPAGQMLKRSGARAGDGIYVSGTIGDAALGLLSLQHKIPKTEALEARYFLPEPRMALGASLRGIASSCMDVSDGLAQDLGHICKASFVGVIQRTLVPLSAPAAALVKSNPELWEVVLGGGDDYELIFTAPGNVSLPGVVRIGEIVEGSGVTVLDVSINP